MRAGACPVSSTQRRPHQPGRRPPATLRGYDKPLRRIYSAVLAAQPLCRHSTEAGRVTAAVLVDHIVPLPVGTHDRENLQPLCQQCQSVKTASERQREG